MSLFEAGMNSAADPSDAPVVSRNARLFVAGLLLLALGIAARLVDLQVVRHDELAGRARTQVAVVERTEPRRGTVEAAGREILAVSRAVESLWAVPRRLQSQPEAFEALSAAAHLPVEAIRKAAARTVPGPDGAPVPAKFSWIKRKLTAGEAAAVRAIRIGGLPVRGLDFVEEFQRIYPHGTLLAHLLGGVGLDDHGVDGLEAMLEADLGLARRIQSVYADPARLPGRGTTARLASAIGLTADEVEARLRPGGAPAPGRVRLKSKVSAEEASAVTALGIPGVSLLGEYEPIEAPERAAVRDFRTRRVASPDESGDPLPAGATVRLTIDLVLQQILEEELDAAVREYAPRSAWAVVLDPKTGAVLAMTSRPTFDPNRFGAAEPDARRNRCLTDPFEPGSTFKPFILAWALEHGVVTPRTPIYCENGLFRHGARILHDHHPYGTLTVREVIEKSSNIGIAKIALLLKARRLYDGLARFGFGRKSGVDLPAEDPGLLHPFERWNSFSITSVPMGHEILTTPLQLAAAFCSFANGGMRVRPYVVDRVTDAAGIVRRRTPLPAPERILKAETVAKLNPILTGVVEIGTGKKAQVPGYAVAGKTGTTQLVVGGHYSHEAFISSFVAFAPAEDARLCVLVSVDRPQGAYYGGTVAAPVVGKVFERALPYLGVAPRTDRAVAGDGTKRVAGKRQ